MRQYTVSRGALDWIRAIANFVKFGLDPDYKYF